MDKVYRKFLGDSVSFTINFKSYFEEFQAEISKVKGSVQDGNTLHGSFSNLIKFTDEQEDILAQTCSIEKLDPPTTLEKFEGDLMFLKPELYEVLAAPKNCKLKTIQNILTRNEHDQEQLHQLCRHQGQKIIATDDQKSLRPDLGVDEDVVFTILIYAPFKHMNKYDSKFGKIVERKPKISQELLVLGSQTFDVLRDAVLCVEDFNDTQGDISEEPFENDEIYQARNKYVSAMFYFGNDFYIDTRNQDSSDYSQCIRDYGVKHGSSFGETKSMETSKFIDLKLKLGHPYVYQHQGNCEHLIVFKSARLIHHSDVRITSLYPVNVTISPSRARFCNLCGVWIAKWCVQDCDRLPNDPSYLCKECFKNYLYIDGKKIGTFKAYKFCDTKAIM